MRQAVGAFNVPFACPQQRQAQFRQPSEVLGATKPAPSFVWCSSYSCEPPPSIATAPHRAAHVCVPRAKLSKRALAVLQTRRGCDVVHAARVSTDPRQMCTA
eukprot:6174370-Pleurochrysis_carterae.AAC.1